MVAADEDEDDEVEEDAGDQGEKRSVLEGPDLKEEADGMGDDGGTICCGSCNHPE